MKTKGGVMSPTRRLSAILASLLIIAGCTSGEKAPTTVPPASTSIRTSTTALPATAIPLLITNENGILVRDADGSEHLLTVDGKASLASYFMEVSTVLPDGEGGLLFQLLLTPPPWPDGSVLWLPAGSTTPQVLVAPDPPAGEEHTVKVTPLQMVAYRGAPALLYDVHRDSGRPAAPHSEQSLRLQPLAGGPAVTLLDFTDPPRPGTGDYLVGASWGGDLLVTVWTDGDSEGRAWLGFFDDAGAVVNHPHNPLPARGTPAGPEIGRVFLAQDDRLLIWVEESSDQATVVTASQIVVYDLEEGIEQARFEVGPIWYQDTVSFDGARYLTISHKGFYEIIDITSTASPEMVRSDDTVRAAGAVELAAGASLGSIEQLGCSASTGAAPAPSSLPDLPAETAKMRSEIVQAARDCDYEELARLKAGTVGSAHYAEILRDLLTRELNNEPVLDRLAGVLELAYEITGTAPARTFVWPSAVFPTLDGWGELADLYSDEELAGFVSGGGQQFEPGTYKGVAVGITEDGRWVDPSPRRITLPQPHQAGSIVGRYGRLYPSGPLPVGGFRLVTLGGVVQEVIDPWYASTAKIVIDDLAGGIVFQYLDAYAVATPPTYRAGSILRLSAGAQRPEVIRQPNDRQMLFLLGVDEIEGVPSLLYVAAPDAAQPPDWAAPYQLAYTASRSLYLAPLDGGPARLIGTWGDDPGEPQLLWASYGDGRLLLTLGSAGTEACRWFEFVELGGGRIAEPSNPRPGASACDDGTTVRTESFAYDPTGWVNVFNPTLSRDGSVIVYEERSVSDVSVSEIVIHSVLGGTELGIEVDLGIAYDRHRTLIVYTKGDAAQVMVVFDHDGTSVVALPDPARLHVLALLDSNPALAANATLDSGAGDLVCSADGMTDMAFELVELPGSVANTRAAIIAYSVACDYTALAGIAGASGAFQYSNLASESPWIQDWRCQETPGQYAAPSDQLVPYWVRDDVHIRLLNQVVTALNGPYRTVGTGEGTAYVWGDSTALIQIGIGEDGRWLWATTWDDGDWANDPCSGTSAG